MADNKRIAKNTLFLYVRMLLIMGINLYVSRVVLRELGAEDFGLYNVIGGVVVIFSFLNGALSAATSRFITFELGQNNEDRLSDVFSCSVIIHLLIALVIVLLSETIGLWLFYEKMTIPIERMTAAFWVFQISIITCVFSVTQVPYTATIIAHEQMKIYAYVGILEVILKLVVVYLIAISPIDKL
ncbi:MAG: multidrug transporter, partial [Bacteroidales bacterium]|nr:multidrug transporter [Bacteroidales bacterium]